MKKLRDEQRKAFNARLAAALLAAKKRPESPEEEPGSLLDVEDKIVDDEKMEEFSADWVQQQMSEAEWKKLSEQERQRLIAIAKLEQKKLQKEMYGDDYLKAMKSLEGDEEAMKKLRDDQRKAFDARLAAALLAAKNRPDSPEPESLLEVQEKVVDDEKLEQFSADWVQQQMNETEWKQLSEQERQRLIAIAKLEQKKLQKEIYGDDYLKAMKSLEGDEEATKKLQEEQRKNFDARLAAALAVARKPKVEKLDEIQEVSAEEIPPEKVEQFCADWVKDEMDAAEWKKLSEQERQKLIALAKLEQKKLQKEIYGDDFTMKLKQLEGDEAAIQALREEQRTKFNALLAARVLKKEKPILIQVLDEKIEIVSQFGDEYKKQVASQAEIVKTLDENDEGVLFAATLNLLQVAIAIDGAETSAIDQIPLQGPTMESLKLVSRPKDEQKLGSIEKYTSFKGWDKLHPFFAKNLELINVYSLALQEAQFVYEDEKVKLGAQEFKNYPHFWLKCREYQIFHQFEEGKDDRFVKRSLREVIALKTVIDNDFSLEKFQVLLGRYFYRNLESPESVDKVIKEKNLRFMLGALLLDFTELFEKSPEKQSLRKHIVEKYNSMRDRALMVIARGDPQQGLRPVSEARVEVDKMKKELEATFYERKAMAKYMKSRGFAYSSPPEKAFGPNLGRSYDSVLTSTTVIKDEEIIPESDLSDTFDLYFVLYQYEQMEIAFHILHDSTQNPSNEETLWQKNEKERLDLISEFIEAIHTSQLSVRSRQRAILDGKEIKQDRQRYIQLARLGLAQKESRKVLKDQSAPKDSNSSAWLSFGDNVILRMLQNAKAIVIKILNDSFQEELRDFCMLMPEADRAQEIIKTNEERTKIDPTHASAKIDNNSLIQKGLALVYANKMHLAIKLGASEMNSSDICAAILAELLEEFDNFRESEWKVHSKATSLELERRLNSEIEAGTSEEIWKLISGKTSVARAEVAAEHDEVVDKKRDDIIAAALLKSVGQQEWQRMSEKDRQMKILEMKRLQRQNEKESVGFSSKKLLEDFNGNEEAYRKYKETEKAKSNQALDAKIAALKAKKAAETDAKKQAEAEEEIKKLTTLKRSLSDLQKVELDADKEKLAIMEFLESSDGKMSQEKMRQMAALKLRMQKKQLANGEIEDTAIWIRSTEDKSAAGAAAEKQRQKELAKARLAALKAGRIQKSEEPVDQNASKEDQLAALLENMQKEELAFVYARIEKKKYKSLGSDRIELLSKLDATEDVEMAVDIRLALITLTNEEPDVEILRLLAEEQKKVSYEALNRDTRGDFEDLLEDVKMKSVRNVAFGVGSDEEVERELASKYRAVKRQASRNAIKEEISDAVWDELDEKEQEKLIDEIASSDDIDAAIKNHKRIAELSMKAKKEDLKTEAEKQESAKKRKNVLDDLSKNYDRELQGILAAADQQADRQKAEKARQLKIAMIRKERKQIEKENKTEEIGAFVREMTMASANTEKRVNDERKRQQERQKEKLAAMKRKRQTMTEKAKEEQIQQEIESFFDKNEIENNISDIDSFTEDTLFDQVLTAMTSLHSSEISALHTLMVTATDNKDALADAEAMDLKKLEKKLSGGSSSYFKRRLEYYNIHLDEPLPEHMIPSKQVEQKTLLTKAMILRFVKFNKEKNISKSSESPDAYEEATIYLSSELTTRQALELKNFESMLEDLEDPVLKEVIKLLKRAKNEFWSPNITSVMFYPPMTKEDGPALAQAWINQAKKRSSGAAAGILIDQKISQKRKDDRASENIMTRQHTIIQTNITAEEEQALLDQFQQNMLKRQSTIVESRKSQMQKILERKSQLKEKQQERKAAEVEKALLAMDREKTMMINTRKSQSTGLENRLGTLRLERTLTQARKSQGGLNFANQANEGDDMEDLAQKLQATATIERQDTNELLLEINNAENATKPAEEEAQGDSLAMMRERTMMRKSKKKNKE